MATKKRTIKQRIALLTEASSVLERLQSQIQDCTDRISGEQAELAESSKKLDELRAAQAEEETSDRDIEIRNTESSIYWNKQYLAENEARLAALNDLAAIIEEALN